MNRDEDPFRAADGATIETGPRDTLTVSADPTRTDELRELAARAAVYAAGARSSGSRRVYRSAWRAYRRWCDRLDLPPLSGDPGIVGMYLAHAADRLHATTVRVHLAAIAVAHRLAGLPFDTRDPRIALVLDGVMNAGAGRTQRRVTPIDMDVLSLFSAAQPDTAAGTRNRAMLLIGFGAALRRSELVALTIGDVERQPRGLMINVRRSKTDQRGEGALIAVASADDPTLSPTLAFDRWMSIRGTNDPEAPLFCAVHKSGKLIPRPLSDQVVALIVKKTAEAVGLDPTRYSGHSLRAGLATAASDAEAELHDIMRQTRHLSTEVARRYMRGRDLWRNNVTMRLFKKKDAALKD